MLNRPNTLHARSRFFRCVLALVLVFAFCPSSESYAIDLRDKSENADLSVCENKITSGDDVELLSDVVLNCPYDYVGVVVGEDDLVIDWGQAKSGGASFAFVSAGEMDPDGAYVRNGNLSNNLEACMDYGIPFSLFVSGVKSHSDIATPRCALFDQLVEYDSINVFFVLDETADVRSVLSAIADLKSDCPTISFGIGADESCFQDNASIANQTSVQRWVNDGWADCDDEADYHQLNRVVAIPGCEGSFCVIGGNCLSSVELDTYPLEEPKGNDSEHSLAEAALCEVEEEGGSSASSPRVLADGVYEVSSAIDGAKALDIAGGSRDDGARLQLWSPNSTPAQRFRVAYDEASGFYSVENIGSGKVLDAAAGRWEDGTAVQQYSANGTAAQLWSIEPDGDGYRVCSALNRSQVLDVPGADASDGAGIQLYGTNGSLAQRWSFKRVSCPVDFQIDYSGRKITPIDKYDGRVVVALPSSADSKSVTLRVGEKQTTPLYLGSSCVLGQGEEVSFADVGLDVSPGAELSCPVLNKEGDVVCTLVVMRSAECASIFLSSDDPQNGGRDFVESNPDHSASAKGNMLMLDEGGSTVYDGKLDQIKGRGNSTWAADKRPYQIKLKKKTDLLQSDDSSNKNKTWVLLANAYDASGVRNVVSYSLAQSIGVNSPIEFRIVDLYYDGEYRGTYLLCEKVQVNSGRVEINDLEESNDQANGGAKLLDDVEGVNSYGNPIRYTRGVASPVDITGGYLIELDGRYANERSWFSVSTPNGLVYFVCKNPEGWSYEEADYLSCFMQDAFDALNEDGINHRTGKKTEDYIDIDSFASSYWINELAKNRDGFIFSSTYCYKEADSSTGESKLIFGPAWDFDLTLGNLNDIADPANDWVVDPTGWYTRAIGIAPLFMRDPQVMRIVDDSKGAVVAATRSYLADKYLTQKRALESSMRLNSMVWGEKDETCADVEAWLTARLNWLSSF